ncbi:MAG: ArsR/SmtB family transcription factor [Eggerthellaceae bacterium]|jgi:ArsR family transcriptional regulator
MAAQGLVERMCAYNKAISDPNRMKMIKILGSHDKNSLKVGDIASLLGISQPAATKHLRLMEQAGIFNRMRQGSSVYYSLNEEALDEYREELDNAFAHSHTPCINGYRCETCPMRDTCV